jgi:hypothetical protein
LIPDCVIEAAGPLCLVSLLCRCASRDEAVLGRFDVAVLVLIEFVDSRSGRFESDDFEDRYGRVVVVLAVVVLDKLKYRYEGRLRRLRWAER